MVKPTPTDGQPTVFIDARLVDPATGRDEAGGVLVEKGIITDIGAHLRRNAPPGARVVEVDGRVLCPGLIDMQVFTGEPGSEHRETLETASRAAAAGGVTTIVVMPDTKPVIDQVALVDFVQRRARDNALVNVHVMAAMTRGLEGQEMTEIGLLREAGAIAFSNGKNSVANTRTMRQVLLYSKDFDALVVHHTEDPYLSNGAAMNSGIAATRLGLPGVHKLAETIVLERDVRLVEMTGGRYHAATLSCNESLAVVAGAKARGLAVTCGAAINHLVLNEDAIGPWRTFFRLRPPLRAEADRAALVRGVADGTVDVIVSSHDPQDVDVKRQPFTEAADGAIGLETMLSAGLQLVRRGELELMALLKAMTINPARLLGLPGGRLEKGAPADLIVIDLDYSWAVNKDELIARSRNTPFEDRRMQGRAVRTIVAGETVYPFASERGGER